MKSFVYSNFSDLYINNKISLSSYVTGNNFYICLLKQKYTPNTNNRTYFDIKSSECNSYGYTSGGNNIVVTLDANGALYGSDVSWTDGVEDVRYAVLYLKTSDSNNGLLISCYDFDSSRTYTGTFTLSWNGVQLISITNKAADVDKYVVDLDTKTVYTPDEEDVDDVYKGLTEKKLYVQYSDNSKSQMTLVSLAGRVDYNSEYFDSKDNLPETGNSYTIYYVKNEDDTDGSDIDYIAYMWDGTEFVLNENSPIDNKTTDVVPDFVSYKVFEKYSKVVDKLENNYGTSGLNFIGVLDGINGSEVGFANWLSSHNLIPYKKGDAVIISVLPEDSSSTAENLEMNVIISDTTDVRRTYNRCTPNDMYICITDASKNSEGNYVYSKTDWRFVNSNTVDILSEETVTDGNLPIFDSTGKLLADSKINVEHSNDYFEVTVSEPTVVVSGILAKRNDAGLPIEYLLKDRSEIRPLDPEEAILALGLSYEDNLFDRLSDEEIDAIKTRVDDAYNALGESGMSLTNSTIDNLIEESST